MESGKYSIDADFLEHQGRSLFYLLLRPIDLPARGSILFLPPFAEEMHKSRSVVSSQARRFAAEGYNVLLLDLSGCGDSEGDFVDASWGLWRADALAGLDTLSSVSDAPLMVWGLRTGALLACDVSAHAPSLSHLLLWQPVLNGEQHIDQFLRLRVLSRGLMGPAQFDRKSLWGELRAGHSLEVAGYELSARMALEMARLRLQDMPPSCDVTWYEIGHNTRAGLAMGCENVLQRWRNESVKVTVSSLRGEPFWRVVEGKVNRVLEDAMLENVTAS